jgi:hypothetical protein
VFIKAFVDNVQKMKLFEFGLYFDTLFFAAKGVPFFVYGVFEYVLLVFNDVISHIQIDIVVSASSKLHFLLL